MSSARTRPRFLTVLVTVGLIAGFVLAAPAPTRVLAADPPVPTIAVHYDNALPGEFYGRVATHDWPVGISLTLTVERWNESLEPPAFEQAYTEFADSGPEYPFLQGHDGTDPFFVERGDRVTVTDGTTTKVHDVYSLLLEAMDYDEEIVSGSSDSPDSVCVDLWSLPGPPRQCADPVGGAWLVDFPNTSDYDITPYSDLAAWQYDIDGDATTMNNHLLREPEPPDPGLRAQLMSSGLGVDVEGWNWAWDETSGVKVELFAPSGSVPIATADGFPSPLEHGHHFWVAFDTTFGPNYRIVATGYDSDITREVIVRDIRISHTDRLAGTVTGTAASAAPVNVTANTAESEGISRLATPTDVNLDGVFEWEVDFKTAAGTGESGDPLELPIDVLTGDAQLGSTGAKFSTPRIQVQTSGQQWSANADWLDQLDHDVYLAFDNGAQHFETDAVSPWINELGNGSENFDLNTIDGLKDAFGNGADWTVSVVGDADDAVLAWVTLPLLTLDSVNTTTGEITGQAGPLPLVIEVSSSGPDGWDGIQFEVASSPWSWSSDVAGRNITAMWNSMGGHGHEFQLNYAWPSFDYTRYFDEGTGTFSHFLSSFGGAPLGVRGYFEDNAIVDITIDDPIDTYDMTFPVDTFSQGEGGTGFEIDLETGYGIPPAAVGPGWTFTASGTIAGVPMSKTLVIHPVSVNHVDNETGTASGNCSPNATDKQWIVQVEHDGWGENLYPECLPAGTWSVNFDSSQPASYVKASYQDGDLDVNTAAWDVWTAPAGPRFAVYPDERYVEGGGWPDGAFVTMTIDPATPDDDSDDYTDTATAQPPEWDPSQVLVQFDTGDFEILPGFGVTLDDGTSTVHHTVFGTTIVIDEANLMVSGDSNAPFDTPIHVMLQYASRDLRADLDGLWAANLGTLGDVAGDGELTTFGGNAQLHIEFANDDEGTVTRYRVTSPYIHVSPYNDYVFGDGWDPATPVNVWHNGALIDPLPAADDGWHLNFGLDTAPTDTVRAEQGGWIAETTVLDLEITSIDAENGIVSGRAPEGALVDIHAWAPDGAWATRATYAGPDPDGSPDYGYFEVDFFVDGDPDLDWGTETLPLDDGTFFRAHIYHDRAANDHDATHHDQCLGECGDPGGSGGQIEVYPEFDIVLAWGNGEFDLDLTVRRDGGVVYTETSAEGFDLQRAGFDLQPGDLVTVSDGETTKDHEVRSHTITSLTTSPDNTVSGKALEGTTLLIRYNTTASGLSDDNIESATITVDDTEVWSYTFTNDIGPGVAVEVIEFDLPHSDNDQTFVVAYIPDPFITVVLNHGYVHGEGWPAGETVTVSVDDTSAEDMDYTVEPPAIVDWPGGFPWDTYWSTDDGLDLQPGDIVTATSASESRVHEVIDLTLEVADVNSGFFAGHGPPDTSVLLDARNDFEHLYRWLTTTLETDPDPGYWSTDMSDEIGVPLAPNTSYSIKAFDGDGDVTQVGDCHECGDPGGGGGLQVIADGLEGPHQLAFGYGGLFVTDELGGTIWKIAPDGTISEFVTGLTGPSGIAFSPDGVLHVSDDDHRVVSYDTEGTEHLVLDPAAMPDDAAPLENPNAIAFDAAGNLFIANADDGTISKLDADGVTFTRMFATGFALPQGLVVDDSGNLWVADQFGNITELDPDSGIPTGSVLATGNNNDGGLAFRSDEQAFYMPSLGDDGIVLRVMEEPFTVEDCLGGMQYPIGVAIGLDGWIYVADYAAGQVLRSEGCGGGGDPGGSPYELYADGIAGPYHHAWDDAGNLFVADENGNMVWRIDRNTGDMTQFGPEIFGASGVAFDSTGTLHVSDDEGRVVLLDASGTLTEVVTGLSNPNAIAFDPSDNLYIADIGTAELLRLPSGGTDVEWITDLIDGPQGVVVDPDPSFVWVGGVNGTISKVFVGATVPELVMGEVVEVIDTGHRNDGGLTYNADEQAFYAPSTDNGWVIRVPNDGSGDVEECLHDLGYPRGVSIGPDGWIYVSDFERGEVVRAEGCGDPGGGPEPFNWFEQGDVLISQTDGRLFVYNRNSGELWEYHLPFSGNYDIEYRDQNTLYIAVHDEGHVSALDLASGNVWEVFRDQASVPHPIGIAFHETEPIMYISDEDTGVWRFNEDTGDLLQLTGLSAHTIAVSPSGTTGPDGYIYFANEGEPLRRVHPNGEGVALQVVVDPTTDPLMPDYQFLGFVFHDDGTIVMVSAGNPSAILEIDPTGALPAPVTELYVEQLGEDLGHLSDVALADDGSIFVVSNGNAGLYELTPDGTLHPRVEGDPLADPVDMLIALEPPADRSGEPRLQAFLTEERISGESFTPNAEVLVTLYEFDGGQPLNEPDEPYGTNGEGHFEGDVHLEQGLQPGMVLEVRDVQLGVTLRLELADIRFDSFDPDTNMVAGYVLDPPSNDIFAQLADENYEPIVDEFGNPIRVHVDGTGWELDLGAVGYYPSGLTEARVEVYDADGNGETLARLPQVQVIVPHTVQSSDFDNDSTVDVQLIDITPEGPVTVVIPDVEVNERGEFGVPTEEYGVQLDPGDVVIVTGNDTGVVKHHEVFELTIGEVDYENDTISGTAAPNVWVNVGGEFGDETVWSGDGNWTVTVEEGIEEGMMFGVRIGDPDLDFTVVEPLPPPRIIADPFREIIRVEGFPIGHELELTVADDTGTVIGPLYGTVDGPAIGWFLIADGLFIEPGQLVTVRDLALVDPEPTRELVIADIGVSLVDDNTETIFGSVDPGAGIHVQVGTETGFGEQFIETDPFGTGEWTAGFGSPDFEGVDIDKSMQWYLRLAVPDEDGDETVFEPPNASPGMFVEPNQDVVSAEGSGLGDITIRVFNSGGESVHESSVTPDHPGSPAGAFQGFEFDGFVLAGQEVYTYNRFLDLSGQVDLVPGMIAQASDVLWEMEMTVSEFSVESVDSETNTVSGFNPLPVEPLGPGLVGTFVSGPTAFGFDLPNDDNWSLTLTEIADGEPGGVYDITGTEFGLSFGSPTEDQPYDTYTARLWGPPEITMFDLPFEPVDFDNPVVWLDAEFTDIELPDDSHTVTIDWGDGDTLTIDNAATLVAEAHTYTATGVYNVEMTVTDDHGLFHTKVHLVVVSEVGFITGGGWIDSPAGAYAPDPDITGQANFGFVAKYKKGRSVPDGNTNFQFQAAGLHFQSTSYDWLVVTGGDHAKFKGEGTINGEGNYGFMLTAVDDPDGDTFRIKIWDASTEEVVYDNQPDVADDGYDGTALGGGSIVVHDGK